MGEPARNSITEKMRVPVGSLIVDAALVFIIAWWGSSMQTRFEESRKADDAIHARIAAQLQALDAENRAVNNSGRISQLEARVALGERDRVELKSDLNGRLSRIEDKLDRALR